MNNSDWESMHQRSPTQNPVVRLMLCLLLMLYTLDSAATLPSTPLTWQERLCKGAARAVVRAKIDDLVAVPYGQGRIKKLIPANQLTVPPFLLFYSARVEEVLWIINSKWMGEAPSINRGEMMYLLQSQTFAPPFYDSQYAKFVGVDAILLIEREFGSNQYVTLAGLQAFQGDGPRADFPIAMDLASSVGEIAQSCGFHRPR